MAVAAEDELRDRVSNILEGYLAGPDERTHHVGRPALQRNHIISACLELMSIKDGTSLNIRNLCAAAGVPERTLRNAFTEYFGVGPMHLLKARQLQEVRRVLLAAHPSKLTVSSVIRGFGVWDLGQFSRRYRALYGEMPSATLARPPMMSDATAMHGSSSLDSWLEYALRYFTPRPVFYL
jgi:AraC family transcriptional regulator, ethanolamine operon transcriptional activator